MYKDDPNWINFGLGPIKDGFLNDLLKMNRDRKNATAKQSYKDSQERESISNSGANSENSKCDTEKKV